MRGLEGKLGLESKLKRTHTLGLKSLFLSNSPKENS